MATVAYPVKALLAAIDSMSTPYASAQPWRAQNVGPLPPWRGAGTLSGTAPYIVTYAGSPAAATLDLFDRATNIYISSTTSDAGTGVWSFTGLSTVRAFDIRARGTGFTPDENDLIRANQVPS